MSSFRKVIFWCHVPVGVIAGVVILIMSVTGVLLAYEREILYWADTRNYRVEPPSADAGRLPVEVLIGRVSEAQPGVVPATLTLRAAASEPAAIGLNGGRTLFVNPYTGEVLGEGSNTAKSFFRAVTDWHRWLGAQGENRAIARAVTGACNIGFLFLVASGFYLWWPRMINRAQIRNIIWFRRGLPGKARDFNWHNVIGFWSVAPLFIVVLSAVVISYPWASNLVYRLVGEPPPAQRAAAAPAGTEAARQATPITAGLNDLWARAEQQVPGWRSIALRIPTSADAPVTFTIDQGDGGQPQKRAQLALDGKSGEVVRWEPFSSLSSGRQLRSILRFAHTGEVAGIAGQTIAALASAGGAVLVWTGLALAWRRFRQWRIRAQSGEPIHVVARLAEEHRAQ